MRKLIIDTDCGLDDAMAIMLALADSDIELLAITCVHGNTNVDNVVINVSRVLSSCDAKVPIYKGSRKPLIDSSTIEGLENYHGVDGFGDVHDLPVPVIDVEDEHAACALVQFVETFPGEVTIVALGPLTNLALAIHLNSKFSKNVTELYIMGGNTEGSGNVTVSAEANFWFDPEAADLVLGKMECPVTIVPWETCVNHSMPWEQRTQLLNVNSKQASLIRVIEHKVKEHSIGLPGYVLCDQFAMAAMLYPNIIAKQLKNCLVFVELAGHHTRGQMVIQKQHSASNKSTVQIVQTLKMDLFYRKLFDALGHSS